MLSSSALPAVAILRGLQPEHAETIGLALYDAGFRAIEVPLNRENAFVSISILQQKLPSDCLLGAGTVTAVEQLQQLSEMQLDLAISPHLDSDLLQSALDKNLLPMPGMFTPSEAFRAYQLGAKWLKLFPADSLGVSHFRAMKSVLPTDCKIVAVGGIDASNLQSWFDAGIDAVGLGSCLFSEHDSVFQFRQKLENLMIAFSALEK
ncbi:2-dehydro-3-deoxy-6-phosphogalactonate aldolase [Thalassotalea sp. HSM 43]|uniref:2-dehydro-3-deoxy-6-phosphogalactonate aldolase n=1 Tax=Thalassotalea sp. HSM 43 TaxID=2552945 RepID=UPI001081BE44|nr:2-dehydro-3-deoxy-6-phosphogalactonate aldolase [Thalassotalea sp. HSM 43]QBY04234.1 2-dehydro-3-deoxy-6-phosphogalactonate aldolase [Thalassotalea sp. HSM 43]